MHYRLCFARLLRQARDQSVSTNDQPPFRCVQDPASTPQTKVPVSFHVKLVRVEGYSTYTSPLCGSQRRAGETGYRPAASATSKSRCIQAHPCLHHKQHCTTARTLHHTSAE
jgi:hypothetical protein